MIVNVYVSREITIISNNGRIKTPVIIQTIKVGTKFLYGWMFFQVFPKSSHKCSLQKNCLTIMIIHNNVPELIDSPSVTVVITGCVVGAFAGKAVHWFSSRKLLHIIIILIWPVWSERFNKIRSIQCIASKCHRKPNGTLFPGM